MKIACFHELPNGGAKRAAVEFSRILIEKNKVDLYYIDDERDAGFNKEFSSINFFKFDSRVWAGSDWKAKLYKDTIELVKLYRKHRKIAKIINSKNYDLAFVHSSKYTQAPFILRFLKLPTVYYAHESLRIIYDPYFRLSTVSSLKGLYEFINRINRKLIDKKNISYASKIFVNSNETKKNIKNNYGLASTVVYPGVDPKYFRYETKKNIDVLFVGSNEPADGYNLVIDSVEKLKNIVFKSTAENFGKRISDYQLLNLYQRSKIVICASINEPFGMIPLEAMATGAIVIAVNEGGYKETIKNNFNGFLVNRDAHELELKIKYVLSHPTLVGKIRESARKNVEDVWDWKFRREVIIKEFNCLLAKK